MSLDLTDGQSTLAWCHQATSHYWSHCWPRSMPTYDITRPQWINTIRHIDVLVQERRNSIANALELRLSCTNPSTYTLRNWVIIDSGNGMSPVQCNYTHKIIFREIMTKIQISIIGNQRGKLNFWDTRPKTHVLYMSYTKFHSLGPIFYLPSLKCTRIGERASVSLPHWEMHFVEASIWTWMMTMKLFWNGEDLKLQHVPSVKCTFRCIHSEAVWNGYGRGCFNIKPFYH